MREIQVNLGYLIGNAMIEIYKKDKRRIIDFKDIKNYQQLVTTELHKSEVNPNFSGDNEKLFKSISRYFCSYDGNMFIVLPWIRIEELVEHFRKNMTPEVYRCFSNTTITDGLLDRTEKEIERFNEINDKIVDTYINQFSMSINHLEIQKEAGKKTLEKIKDIRSKKI